MADDPIHDPEALRWVEAGVSGLARRREWDAVEVVAVPELEALPLEEFRFGQLADGTVVPGDQAPVPAAVLSTLAAQATAWVSAPFEALVVRRTRREWSFAVRSLRLDEIELPPIDAAELVVAIGPDGEATLVIDGDEPTELSPELGVAVEVLLELGRARFEAFVVRGRRTVGTRWAVSVDPL